MRELELVRRQRLEVVRAVEPGRAVERPAGRLDERHVLGLADVRRALEHDVLEQVREAGLARDLVLGADVVPDVDGHDGREVVLGDDEAQAVGQALVGELDDGDGHARRTSGRRWVGPRLYGGAESGALTGVRRLGDGRATASPRCVGSSKTVPSGTGASRANRRDGANRTIATRQIDPNEPFAGRSTVACERFARFHPTRRGTVGNACRSMWPRGLDSATGDVRLSSNTSSMTGHR